MYWKKQANTDTKPTADQILDLLTLKQQKIKAEYPDSPAEPSTFSNKSAKNHVCP